MSYCTHCGSALSGGEHFCTNCGNAVPHDAPSSDPPVTIPATVEPAPPPSTAMFPLARLAGAMAIVSGVLVLLSLFVPAGAPGERLTWWWTWRNESNRWLLVAAFLPSLIAGGLGAGLGQRSPRWALATLASATLLVLSVSEMAINDDFLGYLHPPTVNSFVLAVAVLTGSAAACMAVVATLRGDRPVWRVHAPAVRMSLLVGAVLAMAFLVWPQWDARLEGDTVFSVWMVRFESGTSVSWVLIELTIATALVVLLALGPTLGLRAAVAIDATLLGFWIPVLGYSLSELGPDGDGSDWRLGIGFAWQLVALALLVALTIWMLVRLHRPATAPGGAAVSDGARTDAMPWFALLVTALGLLVAYVVLAWPIRELTN